MLRIRWWSAALVGLGAIALWHVVLSAQAADLYVSTTGSGTTCSIGTPCTLTYAMTTGCNGTLIDGGDTVHVLPGRYHQPLITMTCSGVIDNPIIWIFGTDGIADAGGDDAYLSGCALAISPGAWSLAPGATKVYQAAFNNESIGWNPHTMVQCSETIYAPLTVSQIPQAPLLLSLAAHPFEFPPNYKPAKQTNGALMTVAQMELQGGTFSWSDANNLIYVHTYDDLAPATHHDLYVRRVSYGTLTITGDYHELRGFRQEYANGGGWGTRTTSTATGVTYRNSRWHGSATQWTGEFLEVSDSRMTSVTGQGDLPDAFCYNPNAGAYGMGTSTGLCFNRHGDGGAVGINSGANDILFQRNRIGQNWNNFSVDPQDGSVIRNIQVFDNNLTQSVNHCFGMYQTVQMATVLRNDTEACQESFFQNDTTGSFSGEMAYNIFPRGVLLESLLNSGVSFHHNIVSILRLNANPVGYTYVDCNIFMQSIGGTNPASNERWSTYTTGGSNTEYQSLAAWQAATPWDDNSADLPYTKWRDGTQFVLFTQPFEPYDFHPFNSASQSVNMGSCGRVGPYDLLVSDPVTRSSKGRMLGRIR